jgi:prevent-host-death family protein
MNQINVSTDIIPIGELKKKLSQYLTSVHSTGNPLIITQNGKPAGVLVSPAEYDELVSKRLFIESVNRGVSDAESGRTYSTAELQEKLNKKRALRKT